MHRSSGEGARSRLFMLYANQPHPEHHHQQQQQQQQQHPFVSARVDQFTSRHQLASLQPVRPPPPAGSVPSWLTSRKASAVDDVNLDRLVEINARQLVSRANTNTRTLSTIVRRTAQTSNAAPSSSTVYGRNKPLPVTNNVAKPFSITRNY